MILVTGATGHIGREMLPLLLENGQQVRILTRDRRKAAGLDARIECVVGNLDQPEPLAAAVQGVEQIFLVTFETQQDLNVLEAAKQAGIRHIVKLSTLEAAKATLQVGRWHREREELIRASGLDWTFLRPGMFMSNAIDWWSASIQQQGAVYFPGGRGKVAPIDPRDVAAVAARVLTQPEWKNQAYELTGPELLSMREMVQILAAALGTPLRYVDIPPIAAKLWMLKSGMDKVLVNALIEMLASLRKNQGAIQTDTAERITGRLPRKFQEWCMDHLSAFQR